MSDAILNIRHLSKSFGQHLVLRDIDFTVSAGDVISIIGAVMVALGLVLMLVKKQ